MTHCSPGSFSGLPRFTNFQCVQLFFPKSLRIRSITCIRGHDFKSNTKNGQAQYWLCVYHNNGDHTFYLRATEYYIPISLKIHWHLTAIFHSLAARSIYSEQLLIAPHSTTWCSNHLIYLLHSCKSQSLNCTAGQPLTPCIISEKTNKSNNEGVHPQ